MKDLIDRATSFKEALTEKHSHITFILSDYKSKIDEIEFKCSRHGFFLSTPKYVLRNRYGCELCYKELVKLNPKNIITPHKTTEEFIAEATLLHKGFYTYENAVYISRHKPIIITCPIHGDFEISMAHKHITNARGCLDCKRKKSMLTLEEFITKCKSRTKSFYVYTSTVYDGLDKEVDVICKRHGVFTILANSHINGKGCQKCREEGKDLYEGRKR